jgi:hypothetical protein
MITRGLTLKRRVGEGINIVTSSGEEIYISIPEARKADNLVSVSILASPVCKIRRSELLDMPDEQVLTHNSDAYETQRTHRDIINGHAYRIKVLTHQLQVQKWWSKQLWDSPDQYPSFAEIEQDFKIFNNEILGEIK